MGKLVKYIFFLTFLAQYSCVEEIEPQSIVEFEDILVVDATITDETKRQRVLLSRTFPLEGEMNSPETGANVVLSDGNGNETVFEESEPGTYLSPIEFAAEPGNSYRLRIETSDGGSYLSAEKQLPPKSNIDSLYANRIDNDLGENGMAILVDTSDPNNNSTYYRYEYEETYRIFAPEYRNTDLIISEDGSLQLGPRNPNEFECFPTNFSTSTILNDTRDQVEDQVDGFLVRFISSDNFILSYRYSILVKQFVHSRETYQFYESQNEFASSESVFSNTQPGFLSSNIASTTGDGEKVLGIFDVASVDEQRIFFNYIDFYPGENVPPYVVPCIGKTIRSGLRDLVESNLVKFLEVNSGQFTSGAFIVVPRVCGDCTALGSPDQPDFWIE
ncbi:DUF4249 family protein [Muricauda sp. JGD-17]|uniref:DUF4249 family protein n=1 Tax=Flagellimonas ochracea TaxID=2696472 RepID=A0A964WW05_9FLAO|nr:DUF4249 domain-containing protein [Allomuricauda ochracea]NAY90521.1 DUF4249 family protein [Allomuricauda ochracea]